MFVDIVPFYMHIRGIIPPPQLFEKRVKVRCSLDMSFSLP